MIFETHKLENTLVNYIETIFYHRGFDPEHSIERVVPTGHVFIIFELDGIERNTFDNVSLKPNGKYTKVWISGMHKDYLSISAHKNSEMLVIQFKTIGAYPFLRFNVNELNNKVVPAQEVFGNDILEVREEMLKSNSVAEKFNIVDKWLLEILDEKNLPAADIISILEQIQTKPISESKNIIVSYPHSQKHLINQFKKFFGLTPKVFHRIFRFNEILQQIRNKQQIKWTDIAYEYGYSDQSHFIKEFKEFSGFNPREFINYGYQEDQPNFFPLDG